MTASPEVLIPFRTSGPLGLADFFMFSDYRTLFSFRTNGPYFLFGLADLISFSDLQIFGVADLWTSGLPPYFIVRVQGQTWVNLSQFLNIAY